MKIIRYILLTIITILLLWQLYPRPAKNKQDGLSTGDIRNVIQTDAQTLAILEKSCYDCHSNNTEYPWYANIQPVAMWLGNHIKEGKRELNFSEFGTYKLKKQDHKLEEVAEQVEKGEMPLKSYTIGHPDAKLSDVDAKRLIDWVAAARKQLGMNR